MNAPDGAGGMYVAWLDQRLGYNTDVYLQRVTPVAAARATAWPDNGASMTFVTCSKTELAMISDGAGVLGVWSDNRCNAGTGFDIYVERFTPAGAAARAGPPTAASCATRPPTSCTPRSRATARAARSSRGPTSASRRAS